MFQKLRGLIPPLLSASLLVTACGGVPTRSTTQAGGDTTASTALTTLRVAVVGMDPLLDAQISAYYDKYPDVRIEKVTIPPGQSAQDLLKAKVQRGELDVIPAGYVETMLKDNLVVDLAPYIQKTKFDTKPYGPLLEQMKWDGKLYDLPIQIYPNVVIYNTDLFQKAGLQPPADGWTWDQFRELARKLTSGSGDGKVYGFSNQIVESLVDVMLEQRVPTGYGPQASTKEMTEVWQFANTLVTTDQTIPKPAEREWGSGAGFSSDPNLFQTGKAGMTLESISMLGYMGSTLKFKYDVAPVPTWPGGKNTVPVGFRTYGLAANSKQPDAAWRFLAFMCGPEGAVVTAKAGSLPAYRSPAVKKAWFDRQPSPPPGTEALFSTDWTTQPRTEDVAVSKLFSPYRNALNAVLTGKKSVDDAVRDYQQQAQQIKAQASK